MIDIDGQSEKRFSEWFDGLDSASAANAAIALAKALGPGVFEYKIDFGPGYRIYFGKEGESLVILLGGGTKKRQQQDIAAAQEFWTDYKRRKKKETQ